MKYKVVRKQENSRMCLICGSENPMGFKAAFYELENDELVSVFIPAEQHQSYPGILHGGMISAILDETIGRAILLQNPDTMGVTIEMTVRYLKPVPLNKKVKTIGRITHEDKKFFEGTGEIILGNADIAARGHAKFMKIPLNKIISDSIDIGWKVTPLPTDPTEIEYA